MYAAIAAPRTREEANPAKADRMAAAGDVSSPSGSVGAAAGGSLWLESALQFLSVGLFVGVGVVGRGVNRRSVVGDVTSVA